MLLLSAFKTFRIIEVNVYNMYMYLYVIMTIRIPLLLLLSDFLAHSGRQI